MAKAVLELEAVTGNWNGGLRKAQTALQNFIETNGGLHGAIQKDSKLMADAIAKMGDMGSKAKTVSGRLRDMESMYMQLGDAYQQMTAKEKADPIGKRTIESLNKLKVQILDTKKNIQSLQSQISIDSKGVGGGAGFGKQLLNGIVPGLGAGLAVTGVMAAVKGMQLLKEQTIDTIKVNMEFEQSNANLAAILGKTTDQIYMLTENAKQLGGSTIFTASQISELQTVLSRRGFGEDQILNMTHGIANLAIATGTDLAQSAELAASTMQSFGMRATDMERIVSVLGVSTTKSALTTQALGTSLQYVAPTARAAGFSLEDTVAMLGALVDAGIDASTAGTSLRQIILGMSTANGKLANSFGHPIRGLKDFVASIRKLKENGGASLDEISKKVRVTAVPAFLSLVENADRLEDLRGSITGVEEELDQMAKKQMDTAKGASIILKSAWEGLKLTFAESNGTIKVWLEDITKLINAYKEHRQYMQGGQAGVNSQIGDEEKFRKETEKRAKDYIEKWNNDEAFLIMKGTRTYSEAYYNEWGVPYSNTIDHDGYSSVYDEAADKLKEQKALYEQLIPLSKTYAKHQKEAIVLPSSMPGNPSSVIPDEVNIDVRKKIKEILGQDMTYDQLNNYLTEMYKNWKMFEAIGILKTSDDLSGLLGSEEPDPETPTGTVTIVERANDVVSKALLRYEQEMKELENRLGAGLIDKAEFDSRKVGLTENVWEAYGRADMLEPSGEWKKGMAEWATKMKEAADAASESDAIKKVTDAEERYAHAFDMAAMKEEQGLQNSIEANKQRLNAEESLYKAYSTLYYETENPKYLEEMDLLAEAIKSWREIIEEQENLLRADKMVAQGVQSAVGNSAWNRISQTDGGALRGRFNQMKLQLQQGVEIPDDVWEDFVKDLNEKLAELKLPTITVNLETSTVDKMEDEVKDLATKWGYVENAVSSVGSALETVGEMTEDPSTKIAGIIATAVASTALGFAQAATADSKFGTLAWVAAAAAGLANMTAMIASIKSVTAEYHAGGGEAGMGSVFVPRGKDTIPAMLAPREEVLPETSWRHQRNIGKYLSGSARQSGGGGGSAQPYVSGEYIYLGLSNYLQRTGRGEIITSRR